MLNMYNRSEQSFPQNAPLGPKPQQSTADCHSPQPSARPRFLSRHQTLINFWLDTWLLLNFAGLVWISVIVRFVFPPATASHGYHLWGWNLHQWIELQFAVLAFFFAGIVVHLMLHWPWVCGVLASRILPKRKGKKKSFDDGQRTILGVGLMIVLLNVMGIAIAAAFLAVQRPM